VAEQRDETGRSPVGRRQRAIRAQLRARQHKEAVHRTPRKWWDGPLAGVVIGAVLAIVGSLLATVVTVHADQAARNDDQAAVGDATREERKLDAYTEFLTVLDKLVALTREVVIEVAITPDDNTAESLQEMVDRVVAIDEYADDSLAPSAARVQIVGSAEAASLAQEVAGFATTEVRLVVNEDPEITLPLSYEDLRGIAREFRELARAELAPDG
jgi:hypothetical protein